MSKTILVTGGTGFIGNCFCKLLLAERPEYRVLNVDVCTYAANPSTIEEELKNPNYKFYKTDIRDRAAIEKIFEEEKPDIVVNFAAESHVDRSITNPQIFLETNILGTAVLMDACRKYGIERYHQVSVYCILKIPTIAEGNPKSCMRNFPIIADVFGISLSPQ